MMKTFLVGMCLCTALTFDNVDVDVNEEVTNVIEQETNIDENITEVLTDDTYDDMIESNEDEYIFDPSISYEIGEEVDKYIVCWDICDTVEASKKSSKKKPKKPTIVDNDENIDVETNYYIPFYEPYTVMTIISDESQIEFIENTYNFTLKSYDSGVATFDTNGQDPLQFVVMNEEELEKMGENDIIFSLVYCRKPF